MIPTLGQTQEPKAKAEDPAPETQQTEPAKPPQLPSPKQEQEQPPAQQKPLCDEAKAGPESDLCQQWRMAQAAEKQVHWTRRLYFLTFWEIGALVLTLLATATAAIAAVVAAKAASAAVKITSDTAKHQLRAYAGTKDARITMTDEGKLSYRVRYENYGQTPAFNLIIRTSCTVTPLPLNVPLTSDTVADQDKSVGILWPGSPVHNTGTMLAAGTQRPGSFTPEYREDIAAGRAAIFLHGDITYLDIFRKPRKTIFRLMYTGPWGGNQPLIFCEEGNEAT